MRDGIDGKAFRAELRASSPEERRRRRREFAAWLRAATRSGGHQVYVALAIIILAAAAIAGGVFVFPHSRPLLAAGVAALLLGQVLNWTCVRRARRWRERHPFEQWRGQARH